MLAAVIGRQKKTKKEKNDNNIPLRDNFSGIQADAAKIINVNIHEHTCIREHDRERIRRTCAPVYTPLYMGSRLECVD